MRIKITSNGRKAGAKVTNLDTGEELQYVKDCRIDLDYDGAHVTLTVEDVALDIEANVSKRHEIVYESEPRWPKGGSSGMPRSSSR